MAERTRIRATVHDDVLETVIRTTKVEPKTRGWWASYPFPWAPFDLELGVWILAYTHLTEQYQDDTRKGRRRNGRHGGRPRLDDDRAVSQARDLMTHGQGLCKAAAAVGMSAATLSRRLRWER